MHFEFQKLNTGEQVAAGSALALLVCMFFGWFNFGFTAQSAWESLHYISPILAVAIAFTVGVALVKASGKSLGDVPDGSTIFVLGCIATALVLFRLIDPVSYPGAEGFEASGSVEAGLFLGLLASAGIAAGGYLATGGTALDQLRERFSSATQASPSPAPGPVAPAPSSPPPATAAAFCEACGAALAREDRFCSACGSPRPSQG